MHINDNEVKPANMPWLLPYLTVKDMKNAINFYENVFNFTLISTSNGPDGKIVHAELAYQEAFLMLGPEGAHGNQAKAPNTTGTISPVILYVYCHDVDAIYNLALAAGAKSDMPPTDMFWGDRICRLNDLDGHGWSFAKKI